MLGLSKILQMKTLIFCITLFTSMSLFAQEAAVIKPREFKVGLSGNVLFANNMLGTRVGIDTQVGRVVFTEYYSSSRRFGFGDLRPKIMLKNDQVGMLAGYDFHPVRTVSFNAQLGLCAGSASWRGKPTNQQQLDEDKDEYPGTQPRYSAPEEYRFVGVSGSLSFNWYFCRFAGIKLNANGVLQRHPDYSFGIGLVAGYFSK